MLPRFPPHYAADVSLVGIKYSTDFTLDHAVPVHLTNLYNVVIRKFAEVGARSLNLPPLGNHVIHVVLSRPEKQVRRVAAWRIVALVKNPQSIGDGAVMNLPTHNMRSGLATAMAATRNVPIVRFISPALPLPTFVRAALVHLCPKPLFKRPFDSDRQIHRDAAPNALIMKPAHALRQKRAITVGHRARRCVTGSFSHRSLLRALVVRGGALLEQFVTPQIYSFRGR